MNPSWYNDWGKAPLHTQTGYGGPYNDGVFVPLFTIFVIALFAYYAVVMIRRQFREQREWREKRERKRRRISKPTSV
jgi:hypothetical protein